MQFVCSGEVRIVGGIDVMFAVCHWIRSDGDGSRQLQRVSVGPLVCGFVVGPGCVCVGQVCGGWVHVVCAVSARDTCECSWDVELHGV